MNPSVILAATVKAYIKDYDVPAIPSRYGQYQTVFPDELEWIRRGVNRMIKYHYRYFVIDGRLQYVENYESLLKQLGLEGIDFNDNYVLAETTEQRADWQDYCMWGDGSWSDENEG